MKQSTEKRFSRTILAASIAAIGLSAPLVAQAGDDFSSMTTPSSKVEVGVSHVSDDSFKFGDYGRGMEKSGAYLIGNVQMYTRGDNNASYLEIIARNLGLDGSRDFRITGGEQGNYGLSLEYNELSKLHSDTYQSPYDGLGTAVLTQPAGVTDGANPGAMAGLAASMKAFNVATKRQATALGLTKQLTGGWDVAMNFKREEKDGTKLTGAPIQIGTGGSRGTLLAPEPINYTTDLFDAVARYADEKLQVQVDYHASLFDNDNKSLTWDNLYTGTGNATGRLGQMPDNQLHQVSASAGYTLSKETRLTGSLSLGRVTQNEAFLPYSTGGVMPATASLNGRVDTTHADIKLNTKLTHDLVLNAGYKYDERDNRTPMNEYDYITADRDAGGTGTAINSLRKINTPLSKEQQLLYADIDYHLSKATTLKLGYDYDKIKHTYEPSAGDEEHTLKAEVRHNFGDASSAGLAYAYSERDAEPYDVIAGMSTYTPGYLAALCNVGNTFMYNGIPTACTAVQAGTAIKTYPWVETPALRKFFLTDRKRDKLRAYANVAASERLDLQFGGSFYEERYPDAEAGFGLVKATGWSANFDANLAASDTVSGLFFLTVEDTQLRVNAHQGSTTNVDREANNAAFAVRTGVITRTDRSLTAGLGFKVKQDDSFDWGGNFTHTTTTGLTGFSNLGSAIAASILPVPDAVSRLNRLELFGKYKVQKDVTLNLGYAHEDLSTTDWGYDGQTLTSSNTFIGSGQASPDYRVNVIAASVVYSFK